MKDIAKIVIAILLVILAWKIVKGVFSIVITLAAVGLLVWGGMKLLGSNDSKRIRSWAIPDRSATRIVFSPMPTASRNRGSRRRAPVATGTTPPS